MPAPTPRTRSHRPPEDAPTPESANERFKRAFTARLWGSILVATLLHFAVFALWPTMTAPALGDEGDEETTLVTFPPLELPEPPQPLARPVPPADPGVELPDDATIAPTTLVDPPELLPPPPETGRRDPGPRRDFGPVEVLPELRNPEAVRRALLREYPASYQEAGIGGTVIVEFHLATDGSVLETGIVASSGHAALDRAALRVAETCRFSPAMNRDRPVSVWVTFPVVFEAKEGR